MVSFRDLTSKTEAMKLTGPHKSPVLEFDWHNSLLVSGDKDGYIAFWVLYLQGIILKPIGY